MDAPPPATTLALLKAADGERRSAVATESRAVLPVGGDSGRLSFVPCTAGTDLKVAQKDPGWWQ